MSFDIGRIHGWVVDVDGCLVRTDRAGGRGGTPFPGAIEFLEEAERNGHRVVICTNASERPPVEYAAHLRDMGFPIANENIVTAGSAVAEHVMNAHPGARVLAVGAEGITDPLREYGVELADPNDQQLAEVVVIGAANQYLAAELNAAALAVDAGAAFYTTVNAPWFHGGNGRALTVSGAMAASIAWATGREPTVAGKPSAVLAESLLRQLGVNANAVAVVGDALAEIQLAKAAGANAITVLSGSLSEANLPALDGTDETPDAVFDDIGALHQATFGQTLTATTHKLH